MLIADMQTMFDSVFSVVLTCFLLGVGIGAVFKVFKLALDV